MMLYATQANAAPYSIVKTLTHPLSSQPDPLSSNGRHGRNGRDPTPRDCDSLGRVRPTVHRGREERAREGAKVALPRGRNSHASLPHLNPRRACQRDESDRGTAARRADWPRSHLDPRKRAVPLWLVVWRVASSTGGLGDGGKRGSRGSYFVPMLALICKKR